MPLYDSLAYCETYAGSRIFFSVIKTLEDYKYALIKLWVYTNALIAYRE